MKCFFVNMNFGETFTRWPNELLGSNVDKTIESRQYWLLMTLQ